MFSLIVGGGAVLGTVISIIMSKKSNSRNLSAKHIAKVWLICFIVGMFLSTIAVMLLSQVLVMIWLIVKISAIGLVGYGVYYIWKKIFR